jgi:hypothetical protein
MKTNFATRLKGAGVGIPIICALIFVSAAFARQPSGSAAGLDGQWYHDGKPTRILVAPDNRSITIVNENGQRNDGYSATNRDLVIPSLGISGRVSDNGRRISWTNGTEWTRRSNGSGPKPTWGLGGKWLHDGKPTRIEVTNDGRNLPYIMNGNSAVTASLMLRGN